MEPVQRTYRDREAFETARSNLIARRLRELTNETDLPPYCALWISDTDYLSDAGHGSEVRLERVGGQTLEEFAAHIRALGRGRLFVARGAAAFWPLELPCDQGSLPRYWTNGNLLEELASLRQLPPDPATPEGIAREVVGLLSSWDDDSAECEAGIARAIRDEREACAKVAEACFVSHLHGDAAALPCQEIAACIRARPREK